MRNLITGSLMIMMVCMTPVVQAGTFGDVKIIAELTRMYKTLNQQLQTLKTQNENLQTVKDLYKESTETYETVVNFDIKDIERRINRDFESLTSLDDMQGMSVHQKLRTIDRELDRRIEDAPPEQRALISADVARQRALLSRYETLIALQEAIEKNLEASSHDIDERKAAQIQAQNQSILSLLEVLKAKQAAQEAMAGAKEQARMKTLVHEQSGVYEALQQSGW